MADKKTGCENCENCPMRANYDRNPRSLKGRFWRWHINWCPGWRKYVASLAPSAQEGLIAKYNLRRS